ncbi:glyoxalase/bleomycin resistance/dioxygenase family protein [Maribacter sp.]|nr:glyoxalase/bleomycin resistance/dioxygenase family protein [Maribacter sp.]
MKHLFAFMALILLVFSSCKEQAKTDKTNESEKYLGESELVQPKDLPLIFRRTTLIVRNVDESLKLYRDAIGMEVIYDNLIKRPHPDAPEREQVLRLIFLKATTQFSGVLGLLEYDYESEFKVDKPVRKEGFTPQNIVLLFNSKNQAEQFEKIKKLPNIEIMGEPTLTEYPSYDGKKVTRVMVSKFYDADGFIVEFNKLLDDL